MSQTGTLQLAPGVVFDLSRKCGARKSKTTYGKDELVAFAKALGIAPLPKTNKELCEALGKTIKTKFGKDIQMEGMEKKKKEEKKKIDTAYDCKKKGKGAYTLEEFKQMAKELGMTVGKLKKEALCEEVKKKLTTKTPSPTPKTPSPKPSPKPKTPPSKSPLGYKHGGSHVKIASGLVFNLDVDCKGKKTKLAPQNYNRDDLLKFAKALDMKLKKTNAESCNAIKQAIVKKFPKPHKATPVLKSASPTPTQPVTSKELIQAIKKCLNLKN